MDDHQSFSPQPEIIHSSILATNEVSREFIKNPSNVFLEVNKKKNYTKSEFISI